MSNDSNRRHPSSGELYTPCTDQFYDLLNRMYQEWGSWRNVAWKGGVRMKVLRNLRAGDRKAVSMSLLDRMCTGTGVGSINDFIWFTADDLVALGIWKPVVYVEGDERVQGESTWTRKRVPETDAERSRRLRKARRKRREKERWSVEEVWDLLKCHENGNPPAGQ